MITSDGYAPRLKEEAAKYRSIYWLRQVTASGYFRNMYILHLRREGAIVVTPHMSLPISTINADELFKF